jgi:hypothetical protein
MTLCRLRSSRKAGLVLGPVIAESAGCGCGFARIHLSGGIHSERLSRGELCTAVRVGANVWAVVV